MFECPSDGIIDPNPSLLSEFKTQVSENNPNINDAKTNDDNHSIVSHESGSLSEFEIDKIEHSSSKENFLDSKFNEKPVESSENSHSKAKGLLYDYQ